MDPRIPFSFFIAALGLTSRAHSAEQQFSSGPQQVALLELYTSEGCSSCPPAETWLSQLKQEPGLWREIVPVAYHVSYWDSLGWRDPFASKEFTQRQYAQAASWRPSQVYTPCFVRNGTEWRPGGSISAGAKNPGVLSVTWSDGEARVSFKPMTTDERWEVTAAILGSGFVSDVKAGENAGRRLRHEFVAEQLVTRPLILASDESLAATVKFSFNAKLAPKQRALAVWVQRVGELSPVQATGGWLETSGRPR